MVVHRINVERFVLLIACCMCLMSYSALANTGDSKEIEARRRLDKNFLRFGRSGPSPARAFYHMAFNADEGAPGIQRLVAKRTAKEIRTPVKNGSGNGFMRFGRSNNPFLRFGRAGAIVPVTNLGVRPDDTEELGKFLALWPIYKTQEQQQQQQQRQQLLSQFGQDEYLDEGMEDGDLMEQKK